MKLTITGRIPSKKNSKRIVRAGGRFKIISSSDYEHWHEVAIWELADEFSDKTHEEREEIRNAESFEITLTFFAGDKRKRDLSNGTESVMDLLVDKGIIKDDNWFVCPKVIMKFGGVEPENPRCEIEIKAT